MWDALTKGFTQFLEFVRSPRQSASVLLACIVLVAIPERLLRAYGMDVIVKYRGWLIIPLAVCGAILSVEVVLASWRWARRRLKIRRFKQRAAHDIPYMTAKDKEIIGYLLRNQQKSFTYSPDGGYASVLISKGYIVRDVRPGQAVSYWEVPFTVPEPAWEVFSEHRADFDSHESDDGRGFPWAIPSMLR